MTIRAKICGITRQEDALAAAEAGSWAVGFNFYRASPRYIEPARAATIAAGLPVTVERVGVFVNETRQRVAEIVATVGLTMVQFHGDESPTDCRNWNVATIKALRVRGPACAAKARSFDVDFVLADAFVAGLHGGTGKRLAFELLDGFDRANLILAGGLTPETVAEAVRAVRPYAVDVASGVESAPGCKDPVRMRRFIENANTA